MIMFYRTGCLTEVKVKVMNQGGDENCLSVIRRVDPESAGLMDEVMRSNQQIEKTVGDLHNQFNVGSLSPEQQGSLRGVLRRVRQNAG